MLPNSKQNRNERQKGEKRRVHKFKKKTTKNVKNDDSNRKKFFMYEIEIKLNNEQQLSIPID